MAGRFYPADPEILARQVDGLLGAVPADDRPARAYVVPHAGIRYSGPTAAIAYARLGADADRVRRIILIGPAHHVPLKGCAVPSTSAWRTPLGRVPIDIDGCLALARDGHAVVDDAPHAPEHALEVQLPFLQRALRKDVPVLPIAIGQSTVDGIVSALTVAVGVAPLGAVVVCSTDLSHYLDKTAAEHQDARTAEAVLQLAPDRIGVRDACGVFALRGLAGWARQEGLTPELLHLCTSADTAGDPARVVGYSAFAFH